MLVRCHVGHVHILACACLTYRAKLVERVEDLDEELDGVARHRLEGHLQVLGDARHHVVGARVVALLAQVVLSKQTCTHCRSTPAFLQEHVRYSRCKHDVTLV